MEYTEQQLQEFKEEYARRRRNQYLVSGAIIVVVVGFGLLQSRTGGADGNSPILLGVLFALIFGSVIFSLRNWRCPACGGYLGRSWRANFCASCGVPLR